MWPNLYKFHTMTSPKQMQLLRNLLNQFHEQITRHDFYSLWYNFKPIQLMKRKRKFDHLIKSKWFAVFLWFSTREHSKLSNSEKSSFYYHWSSSTSISLLISVDARLFTNQLNIMWLCVCVCNSLEVFEHFPHEWIVQSEMKIIDLKMCSQNILITQA